MKKIINWFKESNRWKHLLGGFIVGLCALSWFTGLYAGVMVGAALEFKDTMYDNKWDWIDFSLTVAGSIIGGTLGSFLF